MIREATAVEFMRVATGGRNDPLLVSVETEDGESHDVYLKPSARPEIGFSGMAHEVVAACLARDLGLPVNEPFLVRLDPVFVSAVVDTASRSVFQGSCPIAFGSKSAGSAWRDWNIGDVINASRVETALKVFAFDGFIENLDRTNDKPNLLVRGNEMRIIDHEIAFSLRGAPWSLGGLQYLSDPGGAHIFYPGLRGKGLDIAPIRNSWSLLSRERISAYSSALPVEWGEAQAMVQETVGYLQTVLDRLDDCLAELERVLS